MMSNVSPAWAGVRHLFVTRIVCNGMVIATSHKDGEICLLTETSREFLGEGESWRLHFPGVRLPHEKSSS